MDHYHPRYFGFVVIVFLTFESSEFFTLLDFVYSK